jgi:hypothetical protein
MVEHLLLPPLAMICIISSAICPGSYCDYTIGASEMADGKIFCLFVELML